MTQCIKCKSDRIVSISGKCSDCFTLFYKDKEYDGYVVENIGIGDGDYIEFNYCLECGMIQDKFPKEDPKIDYEDEEEDYD